MIENPGGTRPPAPRYRCPCTVYFSSNIKFHFWSCISFASADIHSYS